MATSGHYRTMVELQMEISHDGHDNGAGNPPLSYKPVQLDEFGVG